METSESVIVGAMWICADCYFAHHYGIGSDAWDSDPQWDRDMYESEIAGLDLSDWTCADHPNDLSVCESCGSAEYENGITEFSWQSCELCRSSLGGSRFRMAVWDRND